MAAVGDAAQRVCRSEGRRPYRGQDAVQRVRGRRILLLDAALELIGTDGYRTATVRRICRQAGLTERYFYESFTDRHACLVALYGQLTTDLRATTERALAGRPVPVGDDGVRALAHRALGAFVDHLTEDPRRARIVLVQVVGVSPELERRRNEVLQQFAELVIAVWSGAPGRAITTTDHLIAVGLVGAVNHLLVDWLTNGEQHPPALLVEVCGELFAAAPNSAARLAIAHPHSPTSGGDRT